MELTVLTKKRYDELLAQLKLLNDAVAFTQNEIAGIKNLETQVALAHSQLRAIQDSNNQLAEIAFDEARFTDVVMDKVDELAREAAKDCIDIDEIARDAAQYVDVSDEVERSLERMDFQTGDEVNDRIRDIINDEDLVSESQVEQLIADYVEQNDYITREDVEDLIEEAIEKHTEAITLNVLQLIANKLTGKDTHHANNNRDHGLYISGTLTQGEGTSDGEARA